ncbi:sigma-54-dependent Fis family transcriptional regulator [Acidovorax sp. NB1]|uniref:sigma-54-dependent Fis family transcriptional regulator n=1 Tax=Acidovorax sp. NB1 TaxID=1943571 RepID=UPI0010EA9244|nr:sigma-54-dependent Fis family transcriptional regulator [Acidovorax sp. NB1]GDY37945.1 sigma-54-dependent Fis family transcriptional regulator [Acidovorax sp. NB1]
MPRRRVSLADLHRTAVGQGQALLGTVPAPAPRALGGFDTHGISQHTHPTVADISECLFFSPGDGRIWLQDQRMILLHSEALGSLRRELIDSIGLDKARGLLTRAGYVSGARDARLVRQQWPDAEPTAAAMAGTRLHALEGVVQVEVVHARYNAELGDYDGEFIWHNSSEDDEHIAAYGVGGSPACWMQVGYATGYVSTLFGRMIVFREVECRSSGAAHCRVIGKSAERWDDPEQDLFYLNAQDFVGTPPAALADKLLGKAGRTTYLGVPPGKAPASAATHNTQEPAAHTTMVGASSAFNAACHMLQRVAPTAATVLFTGESGVGKEMFASMLHRISPRSSQPFVAINCAAIPETLVESELFGVERGAYTGAGTSRPGRFERAHGGTLFLDEIGTLSLVAQGKLLRALQEGEVERVGGTRTVRVDVRLVAATNVDLRQAVREGTFREDLFYRLNVFPIHLPPLRERRDDIPLLMSHFLAHYQRKHQRQVPGFSQAAVKAMFHYPFPGNIRELQNLIERAVILATDGEPIEPHHLFAGGEQSCGGVMSLHLQGNSGGTLHVQGVAGVGAAVQAPPAAVAASVRSSAGLTPAASPVVAPLHQAEEQMLRQALQSAGGNVALAGRLLGISRATMAYRVRKFGIEVER